MNERIMIHPDTLALVMDHARRIEAVNKKRRRRNQMGYKPRGDESLINRTLGYLAEAAFAQVLNVAWSANDDWKKVPDVGERWEVRSTTYRTGRLLISPRDPVDRDYVLVTTPRVMAMAELEEMVKLQLPFGPFIVIGWYDGERARRPEWWEKHRIGGGAWFVPQSVLRDVRMTPHG
jgi:hypothetical protein